MYKGFKQCKVLGMQGVSRCNDEVQRRSGGVQRGAETYRGMLEE